MSLAHGTLQSSDATVQPALSRNLNDIGASTLQRASSSKLNLRKLRRPATAPRRSSRLHRQESELGLIGSLLAIASETQYSRAIASSVSTADAVLSSEEDPLLPVYTTPAIATRQPKSPQIPLPPTTNDLSTSEKMNLLKKVKKLSRVLGELPIAVTADDHHDSVPDTHVLDQSLFYDDTSPKPLKSDSAAEPLYTIASRKKALRRSVTIGNIAGERVPSNFKNVYRSQSVQSLRPPLIIPPSPSSSNSSTISSLRFASSRLGGNAAQSRGPDYSVNLENSSSQAHAMPLLEAASLGRQLSTDISPTPSRRSSVSSSSVSTTPAGSRLQRARAAKLSRQLDDHTPPETILHSASSPAIAPSPTSIHLISSPSPTSSPIKHPTILNESPRRSSSLRRTKAKMETKKRLSLDLRSLKKSTAVSPQASPNNGPDPIASPSSSVQSFSKRPLKKSRSMWARRVFSDNDRDATPRQSTESAALSSMRESLDTPASTGPVSEKQRLLNVRRAKKMTQLFGDKPPAALFQISEFTAGSNTLHDDEDDNLDMDSAEDNDILPRRRNSLATIISISSSISTSLSINQSPSPDSKRVRDSYVSMSMSSFVTATSISGGGLVTTGPIVVVASNDPSSPSPSPKDLEISDNQGPDARSSHDNQDDILTVSSASSSVQCRSPSPRPSTAPARYGSSRFSAMPSPKIYHPPPSPPAPPPFSDVFLPSLPSDGPDDFRLDSSRVSLEPEESSLNPVEFHARQKRAAKLSHFFGVGMNDLVGVLPANMPPHPRGRSENMSSSSRDGSVEHTPTQTTLTEPTPMLSSSRVEVAATKHKRLRFFGYEEDVKELEMNDAIDKLRRMKSM